MRKALPIMIALLLLLPGGLLMAQDDAVTIEFCGELSDADCVLLNTASDDGYPTIKRVRDLVDGPVVWAPAVDGAVVKSKIGRASRREIMFIKVVDGSLKKKS